MSRLIAVANDFIRRAREQAVQEFSPTKVHNLVYLAHGWRIGSASEMLFETPAMAHRDGVFLVELRDQGCWGTKRVDNPIEVFGPDANGMLSQFTPQLVKGDPALVTLDYVWDQYGKLGAFDTTNVTREPGGAWDQVWNSKDRVSEEAREIPLEVLRKWYVAQFKLRAVAAVSKIQRVRRDGDEHDEATELVGPASISNLRSA
jgi:uncharacterized phage-associated protein